MDTDRFARLLRIVPLSRSRRGALRVSGALGLAGLLGQFDAEAKRRKKRKKCPKPAAPGFCAGKNQCVQSVECQVPGTEACRCYVRADTATSVCCRVTGGFNADNCSLCAEWQICVVLGGVCGGGFRCAAPCPNPR